MIKDIRKSRKSILIIGEEKIGKDSMIYVEKKVNYIKEI